MKLRIQLSKAGFVRACGKPNFMEQAAVRLTTPSSPVHPAKVHNNDALSIIFGMHCTRWAVCRKQLRIPGCDRLNFCRLRSQYRDCIRGWTQGCDMLSAPSGRRGEFTQPNVHLFAVDLNNRLLDLYTPFYDCLADRMSYRIGTSHYEQNGLRIINIMFGKIGYPSIGHHFARRGRYIGRQHDGENVCKYSRFRIYGPRPDQPKMDHIAEMTNVQ